MSPRAPLFVASFPALLCACQGPASVAPTSVGDRPNVVVIDIDSLRADRLYAQRDGQPIAPTLGSIAARGVVFEQAFTQGGWTMPALASVLSGRFPQAVSRQSAELSWLPAGARTLPEILGWYEYETAICAGKTLVSSSDSITGSFQRVFTLGLSEEPRPVEPLATWIEHEAQEPFFALLHDLDLHMPAESVPVEAACTWVEDPQRCALGAGKSPKEAWQVLSGRLDEDDARAQVLAQYDGAIHAYDQAVLQLFEALERRGVQDRTVVVLVSNHGEELGEHGLFEHGVHYDTVLHVPLFIYDPRREVAAGRVVSTTVQGIDIAPTLLELVGVPGDETMDGRSLLPLMDGRPDGYRERPVFSLSDDATASWRGPELKLLVYPWRSPEWRGPVEHKGPSQPNLHGRGPLTGVLFRIDSDPGELHDLAGAEPALLAEAWQELEPWLEERLSAEQGPRPHHPPGGPSISDRLKRDGYWKHVEPDHGQPPPGARRGEEGMPREHKPPPHP
jgi:arylsulfatase A-like enzyme